MLVDILAETQGIPTLSIQNTEYTYRIEVRANTVAAFINGNRIISPVTDNSYTSGGQVGIWSSDCQINVNSFEVVAL